MENWKKISGYENYSVSDFGRVRNDKTGRIMKTLPNAQGYPRVSLYDGIKNISKTVHRLVAVSFIPNLENKPQINHIDGDKINNNVTNLEWVIPSENIKHSFLNGLSKGPKGEVNGCSKLNEVQILEIRSLRNQGWKQDQIAKKFNVGQGQISYIVNKKSWTHI